jgi:23S rRNA (adenine2503-C2)-methyltransferase
MACRFCATGRLGFARSLNAGAIIEQVYQAATRCGKIHNVVYMGMGEPFDNTAAVLDSIRILNHPLGLGLGQRHITLSTCGLPEAIRQFAQLRWQVRLAVSLHAPDEALRRRLMPVAGKVPLTELLDAVRDYQRITRRRVTFEYCLMRDVNDSPAQARATADLLQGLNAAVNLIEFNPYPGCAYKPSDRDGMQRFRDVLRRARIETVIRYRRGRSIKAACGQLGAAWLSDGTNDNNAPSRLDQASDPS